MRPDLYRFLVPSGCSVALVLLGLNAWGQPLLSSPAWPSSVMQTSSEDADSMVPLPPLPPKARRAATLADSVLVFPSIPPTTATTSPAAAATTDQEPPVPPAAKQEPGQASTTPEKASTPDAAPASQAPALSPPAAAPETVTERRSDGTIRVQRQVTLDAQGNYVNDGPYAEYDAHGDVVRKGEFRRGKLHGAWMRVFEQGDLFSGENDAAFTGPFLSEATFVDGRLNGIWTIRTLAQVKVIEFTFEKGVRQGPSLWYHANGGIAREMTYHNNRPVGELKEYDASGTLLRRAQFIDGRLLTHRAERFDEGNLRFEGDMLQPASAGGFTFDWWNGTVEALPTAEKQAPMKHGHWVSYYPNGQKEVEGDYDQDVPSGTFTWWFSNGQKQAEGHFLNGQQQGNWITWHPNGQRESLAHYTAGVLTGKWIAWQADGQLREVHEFGPDGAPQDVAPPQTTPPQQTRLPSQHALK